jgi:hypothetical protein
MQISVQQIVLETRGVWVEMRLSSMGTARVSISGVAKRRTRMRRLHSTPWIASSHPRIPTLNHRHLIDLNEIAVRIDGGRNMTWAKRSAVRMWIDGAGSPKGPPRSAGRIRVRCIAPPALFCRDGQDWRDGPIGVNSISKATSIGTISKGRHRNPSPVDFDLRPN